MLDATSAVSYSTLVCRSGDNEPINKVADCFSTCYTGHRGEHDSHCQLYAAEDIWFHYRASDIVGIRFEYKEYTDEADDRNAGNFGKPNRPQDNTLLGTGKESCSHCAYEQLYPHRDLVVQAHFQIQEPQKRNAKDHDIRDEIRYTCAKPALALVATITKSRRPCRCQRLTLGKVVCDGPDQESGDSGESDYLDQSCMFHPGVDDEYTPVQDDQGELEEAERGGPCELLDKQSLQQM